MAHWLVYFSNAQDIAPVPCATRSDLNLNCIDRERDGELVATLLIVRACGALPGCNIAEVVHWVADAHARVSFMSV